MTKEKSKDKEIYQRSVKGNKMKKTWDNLAKGDVLIDEEGYKRMVIEILGDLVFYSYQEHYDEFSNQLTKAELKRDGWKILGGEVEEISIEEAEKLLGKKIIK